ncbi:MAG: hypothetical protein IKS07_07860 [Lachnospiraceae bacterium]|nr:hypothetical protein [Lachnospiraceae bacterium]
MLAQYYDRIYPNMFLYAAVAAILISVAVIVVGFAIHMIGLTLATLVGIFVDPWIVYAVINYLFFPGVMIHETAHALFALLTGAKVTEVALFKKEGHSLGHVAFRNRGGVFLVALQNILISAAPMFVGTAVLLGCRYVLLGYPDLALWVKILVGYLGISMFFHMTMSPEDIKIYVRGLPLFSLLLFGVVLVFRALGYL